jgi:hypothetical protein
LRETNAKQIHLAQRKPPEVRAREDQGIRDALLEVAGPLPRTRQELFAEVRDEWGWEPAERLRRQLWRLVRAGRLRREGAGFVRR